MFKWTQLLNLFIYYCCLVTKSCLTLVTPWTVPTRLLCPWDFPVKNTGVGCHFLLQGKNQNLPNPVGEPHFLRCRRILYC